MNIGICGPINPSVLKDYFFAGQNIPSINKAATAVNTYVKELLRNGHNVIVVTCAIPGCSEDLVLEGENLLVHIVHSNPSFYLTHALSRYYMIGRLRNVLKKYIDKIDVLHAQWTYDFALASKSFQYRLPVFCTVRDWCPYILSLQVGLKKIQWRMYHHIFSKVMDADNIHFIANSDYTYRCIKEQYPLKEISLIFNSIDKEYIVENISASDKKIVFISIANSLLEKRKNIYKLLRAFAIFHTEHPESILKLVGTISSDTPEWIQWNNEGLFNGVEICGHLNHDALIQEIDKSSCLIHPSLEETFGNILIEGMARGIPVIGGVNSGAVPQVLDNGKSGILCDVTSVPSIVEAMNKSCDRKEILSITSSATISLKKKYSSDIIMKRHLEVYNHFKDKL